MVVINIDTTKDSKNEIKEVIKLLQTIVGETNTNSDLCDNDSKTESFTNIFSSDYENKPSSSNTTNNNTNTSSGVFGMFDDNPVTTQNSESEEKKSITQDHTADDILSLLSEEDDEEENDDEKGTIEVENDDDFSIEIVEYD